jgi:hypothetical protein
VAGSAAAAYGLRNLSSSYTGNVVEVRRASGDPYSASSRRKFTAAEVSDGTLVSFVTEPIPKTLNALPFGEGSTWDVTVVDNSNYTFDCNNNTSTVGCRIISTNIPGGTKYRVEFNLTTNSGDASNLKVNRVAPFTQRSVVEGFNSIELDFDSESIIQFRVGAGSNVFNATISNVTVTAIGNDGHVSTWYDQSGNSNNATQSTVENQPKIVSAGALESDGIHFDGTDDALSATVLSSMANGAVFYLFKSQSTSENQLFEFNNGSVYGISATINSDSDGRLVTSADASNDSRNGLVFGATGVTTNQKHLLSLILDSNTEITTATIDGSSMSSGASPTGRFDVGTSRMSIGQRGDNNFSEENSVSEVIIYDTDQSDKRRAIEESIAGHHGITLASFSRDGFVKTWYDQSVSDQSDAGSTPNGFHAIQADTTKQPRVVIDGNLNPNGIKFDGVDDLLDIGGTERNELGIQHADPLSIYTVQIPQNKAILGDNSNREIKFRTNSVRYYLSTQGIGAHTYSVGTLSSTALALFSTNYGGVGTASNMQAHVNGGTTITSGSHLGTSGANTASSPIEFIGTNIGNNYSNFYGESVQEIIIYVSDQTDNRTAIEANIGEHYSIDLPSGVDAGFDQVDGFVETWYDQSGNGNDATQATTSLQPKIVDNGIIETDRDGKVALNGLGAKLNLPSGAAMLSSDGTFSLFAAVDFGDQRTGDDSFNDIFKFHASSTGGASTTRKPQIYIKIADGSLVSSTPSFNNGSIPVSVSTVTSMQLLTNIANPALSTGNNLIYADGTLRGSVNDNTDVNTTTTIGGSGGSIFENTESSVTHFLSEVIYYPSDQSANRPAIEANIANQYGITLS